MDGRRCSLFVLALSLGLCGCIPSQFTVPAIERKNPPPAGEELSEMPEPKSLNPFASAPKREPKLELDMAIYCERKASKLHDSPEQKFRELDEARKIYQEVLIYFPKNVDAYRGLGRVYIAQRDFSRAVANYQKAIEIYPKNAQLVADLSVVYSKQNDFAGAIQKLNKAREMDPENQDFMKMLSVNLVCAGQADQGVEMMARARGRAAAHYYVARIYDRMNRPDEARRHTQMALETNPTFTDARTLLTDLDQRNQRPAAAPTNPANPQPRPSANVELQFVSEE